MFLENKYLELDGAVARYLLYTKYSIQNVRISFIYCITPTVKYRRILRRSNM